MASSIASGLSAEAPEFLPANQVQKLQPPYFTFASPLRHHQPSYSFFYYYPTTTKFHFHSSHFTTATPTFPPSSGFKEETAVEGTDSEKVSKFFRFPRYEWRKKGAAAKDDDNLAEKDKNFDKCMKKTQQKKSYVNTRQQYDRSITDRKNNRCDFPVVPVRPDGDETTVMIKNIPSKYTREMIVVFLENHCKLENAKDQKNGEDNTFAFDFVYLPIDFKTGLNKGYAFVNFTKPSAAWKFLLTASNQKWELFLSHKIRDVVAARLQGKEKLERHFESVNFPCSSEEVLPLCFSPPRDGVMKGNRRTLGRVLYKPK